MTKPHLKLNASASALWTKCTAQPRFLQELGLVDKPNRHAERGTLLHSMVEEFLSVMDLPLSEALAKQRKERPSRKEQELPQGDHDAVQQVVEIATEIKDKNAPEFLPKGYTYEWNYERRLELDLGEGIISSANVDMLGFWNDGLCEGPLIIADWKFGHVVVEAEKNTQLMCYALAAYDEFKDLCENCHSGKITGAVLYIVQPMAEGGVTKRAEVSIEELKEFGKMIRAQAAECVAGGAFLPDKEACKFCPAKAHCPALGRHIEDRIIELGRDIQTIPLDKLASYRSVCDLAARFKTIIDDRAMGVINSGGEVPGLKMKQGRKGARRWNLEESSFVDRPEVKKYAEHLFEKKLITPTKAAKNLGPDIYKKTFEKYVSQAPGRDQIEYTQQGEEQRLLADQASIAEAFAQTAKYNLPQPKEAKHDNNPT